MVRTDDVRNLLSFFIGISGYTHDPLLLFNV